MIEAQHVSFRYPDGDGPAVRDVSMRVEGGEVVGVVGPNGSGKSTLGRLLKGLLLPDQGTVAVEGRDTRADELGARRTVGLVFQNPNSQIVNAVVEQEVAFGPENLGLPTEEIRRRVGEALSAVGLAGQEKAESHNLSMAGKQRVAIASVLAMEPHYVILDEPTAWLEPSARWPLIRAVLDWSKSRSAGLVLVTHRMEEAQICVRLYGMLNGRVEVEGPPQEILEDEGIRSRLALAVPESLVLISELRSAGLPVEQNISLDGVAEEICRS